MKRSLYLILAASMLAACSGDNAGGNAEKLAKLKKQRQEIDLEIKNLEAGSGADTTRKPEPVSVMVVEPAPFSAFIEVQSQITGDQNVLATAQAPGTVTRILVRPGQKVAKGQTLALLDAAAIEQQIKAQEAQLSFARDMYSKQQQLWAQNIGTEVQLLQAKANFEMLSKQRDALIAQRNMYRITSPIAGTVDEVNVKEGDALGGMANAGAGIRVVSLGRLKAEASLGENYLGKIRTGDPVILILPDLGDTIRTSLSYVARSVDPISRAFNVEVRLGANNRLHPNMSARMRIINYEQPRAISVPLQLVQKTGEGNMVFVVEGNQAKSVRVTTGQTASGRVEILSGLKAGDKLVIRGFEELDNGELVAIQ